MIAFLATGGLVMMLGVAALVIDYGQALSAQRKLQASADAAALAGASTLPDTATAISTARAYGATGAKNGVSGFVPGTLNESIATGCADGSQSCPVADVVKVDESASVPTTFGRILGLNSFTVHAHSSAQASAKLDVMILLDRTGSMCQDPDDNFQYPSCPDLAKARAGIEALLRHLDPRVASVALAVTPPAVGDIFNASGSNPGACDTSSLTTTAPFTTPSWRPLWYGAQTIGWGSPLPLFFSEYYSGPIGPFDYHYYDTSGKYLAYRSDGEESYVVAGFANDYLVNGSINDGSSLVSTLRCIQASGSTAYATALQRANSYLQTNGRADARKVLIFMSDGGANSASRSDYPNQNDLSQAPTSGPWSPNILHPCGQGVAAADTIRRLYPNTTIFAVGYAVAGTDTPGKGLQCYQAAHGSVPFATYTGPGPGPQPEQDPSWTARSALTAIADDQKHYLEPLHDPPTEADLTDLFTQIAQTIAQAKLNG